MPNKIKGHRIMLFGRGKPAEMPDHLSKESKSTKFKSFARRAIGILPAVANTALSVANAANSAGFIQNPQLKAALSTANTVKKYVPFAKGVYGTVRGSRHSLR